MSANHPSTELNTMNKKILLGVCGLLFVAGAASASGRYGPAEGLRHRLRHPLRHGRDVARKLDVSESQRELARQAARELAPVADDLRSQARAIVERARELRRKGDREGAKQLLRDELRPLFERAKPQAERAVEPLLHSLTPEQRAKLEAAAQRRGKRFDEQRFSHRLGLALSTRRAQRRLGSTR